MGPYRTCYVGQNPLRSLRIIKLRKKNIFRQGVNVSRHTVISVEKLMLNRKEEIDYYL